MSALKLGAARQACAGFSLIEVIVFTVVLGVVASSMLLPMTTALRQQPQSMQQGIAVELAHERMDLILADRHFRGFAHFSDPCERITGLCQAPSGYTLRATITPGWQGDARYKQIRVEVTGKSEASVESLVSRN